MNYIDISQRLYEGMPVYPRNPKLEIEAIQTATSDISLITIGSHTGTHVDAPRHVFAEGVGVGELLLARLIGECRVLDMTEVREGISVADLEKHDIRQNERILCKTRNSERGFDRWYDDYVYLTGDAAEYLVERKVMLFGLDSLGIKKKGLEDNTAHTALLGAGVVVFEGLNLSDASEGSYEFIGLPLRLDGLDGSPARAVLRQI